MTAPVWSNTDYPYLCLKDRQRTLALRDAIRWTVQRGDVVVDLGAGSGILALFAAAAGARKVFAVELDSLLANSLRQTVHANGFDEIIEVIEGDAAAVQLPEAVDVVIAEMIDTGLIDEQQASALNNLHSTGAVKTTTSFLPNRYETFVQAVDVDDTYYGFTIHGPKHEWPYYAEDPSTWEPTVIRAVSNRHSVVTVDLTRPIQPTVRFELLVELGRRQSVNGLRLSGRWRAADRQFEAFNSLNGDKLFTFAPLEADRLAISGEYKMGAGMSQLRLAIESVDERRTI